MLHMSELVDSNSIKLGKYSCGFFSGNSMFTILFIVCIIIVNSLLISSIAIK